MLLRKKKKMLENKNFISEDEGMQFALSSGALLGGSGLLGYAARDPNFKQMMTSSMHNFLPGFYRKGIGDIGKKAIAAKEGVKGTASAIAQGVSPSDSYSHKSTGVSNRLAGKINENHNAIEKIKDRYANDRSYSWSQAQKDITHQVKESHFKITNDFSNARLYEGSRGQARPLVDYVSRKGARKGVIPYVENSTVSNAIKELGREELDYIKDLQGMDFNKRTSLLKYGRQAIQNPLRGIQFERKVYNTFKDLAVLKNNNQLTQNSFLSSLNENGLLYNKKGKPMFRQLSKTKIAFNLSPSIKTNYDWGGYNGVVVWDSKKPDVVKLLASDKRDIFKLRMKRQLLNYVEPSELKIANFEKDVNKLGESIEKAIEKDITDKPKKSKSKKSKPKVLTNKLLVERHGVGSPRGVDKLGSQHKSIIDAQKALLKKKEEALMRTKTGSKHYTNYLKKRWLPSRIKLGGGAGLAITGALGLYDYLSSD